MVAIFLVVLQSFAPMLYAADADPLVLVYKGTGACKDGCAEAAAEIPASLKFRVRYVSPKEITPELFDGASIWVQPGGNAIKAAKAMSEVRLRYIRNFVRKGGGYVGFCAGAFLADETVDDDGMVEGLGLLSFGTWDYPVYSNEGWGTLVWIFANNALRQVFFNGGASFYINHKTKNVKVLATYGREGLPATVQTTFGKGQVVVTGFHPEATEVWKQGARTQEPDLFDADGSDHDLARDMLLRALPSL